MRRIALVTAKQALALDEDMPPLVAALQGRAMAVDTPCWDDPAVDWRSYDAAVLRSTWDYMDRLGDFLAWTERCASATPLFNPPALVRWNTDKHYLLALAHAGVPVVPTRFVEPGEPAAAALAAFLGGGANALSAGDAQAFAEFVVKPTIGAGSRGAARYPREAPQSAIEHLDRLLRAGRAALLQPYLAKVDERGETALMYLGGAYSHAVRKAALLRPGGALVAGLFAPEKITRREADAAELAVGRAVCAVAADWAPLYVRVDLIHDSAGQPVVLELEMTEPSLFFAFGAGSADRLAQAIEDRLDPAGGGRGVTPAAGRP